MARLSGKLRLFFLPPYSPELNPDEQVWNYLKHNGLAKAGLRSGKELRKYVLERLRSLQRLPSPKTIAIYDDDDGNLRVGSDELPCGSPVPPRAGLLFPRHDLTNR